MDPKLRTGILAIASFSLALLYYVFMLYMIIGSVKMNPTLDIIAGFISFLFPLLALITGIMAILKIKWKYPNLKVKALSFLGISLSIIAIVLAIFQAVTIFSSLLSS